MRSLATLLDDEDAFDSVMTLNYETQKETKPRQMKPKTGDPIRNLMDQSRIFFLNGLEYEYDEKDPIYFRTEPTNKRQLLKNCKSCSTPFHSNKAMLIC